MAGNVSSGRPSTLNIHPEREAIVKAIVMRTMGKTQLGRRYGVSYDTVCRFEKKFITEEVRRRVLGDARVSEIDLATEHVNDERLDVGRVYDSLARRVEKLITKAEENDDDGFALAAMDGLRKVLKDIATMHGKMSTSLSVQVTLSESAEWVTLKAILNAVCEEVPAAREPLLRHMRHHVLSVTKEETIL